MGFLPKTMGARPRLACEIRAEGVVAVRAEDSDAALSAAERVALVNGLAANGTARAERVSAVKRALDGAGGRGREVTLVVPDSAARVLLIDFDELPAKASEALPVVRFRLKKLLPFDADDAAVSYQVMAETRGAIQVLAVAMAREVLAEYESLVREAGYEPGAVLPSTLAALAGLDGDAAPALVVNAGRDSVTTAIVKDGVLLLHRTVDLGAGEAMTAAIPAATPEPPEQNSGEVARDTSIAAIAARFAAMEGQTTPAPRAPEAPVVSRVSSTLVSGMAGQSAAVSEAVDARRAVAPAEEIAQAVNVATAYFEDTLQMQPRVILSAGPLGAEALARMLGAGSPQVEEMVNNGMLDAGVSGVPVGWLAGVRGALKS